MRPLLLFLSTSTKAKLKLRVCVFLARVIAESLAAVNASSPVGPPISPSTFLEAASIAASHSHSSQSQSHHQPQFFQPHITASPHPLSPPSQSPHAVHDPAPARESSPDQNETPAPDPPIPENGLVAAGPGSGNGFEDGFDGGRRVRAEEARRDQLAADEEFARQLLREEANLMYSTKPPEEQTTTDSNLNAPISPTSYLGSPPQYDESVAPSSRPITSPHTLSLPQSPSALSQISRLSDPLSLDSRPYAPASRQLPSQVARPQSRGPEGDFANPSNAHAPSQSQYDRLGRSMSAQAALPTVPRPLYSPGAEATPALAMGTRPSTVIPVASDLADARGTGSDAQEQELSREREETRTPTGRPRLVIDGFQSRSNGSSLEGGAGGSESGVESVISPLTPESPEARDEGRLVTREDGTQSPMVERDLLQGVCEFLLITLCEVRKVMRDGCCF